jgi:predicted dehydrogenase
MRLGFVGVGKWAQKLASAFRECGAEIVAHDRKTRDRCYSHGSPLCDDGVWHRPDGDAGCVQGCDGGYRWTTGFGRYAGWQEQLADKSIDAIIAVATPEVTTEVALACAAAGKPVMATKPLFDHPETIHAPFYVDFWRLWSEAHSRTKEAVLADPGIRCEIDLYGNGPFRSFPGAFDYGPHVIAAMLDIWPQCEIGLVKASKLEHGDLFTAEARYGGRRIVGRFGNGAAESARRVVIGERVIEEEGSRIGAEEKVAVLRRFCQSFLDDVSEGFASTRLLDLSRRAHAEITKIREMAVSA